MRRGVGSESCEFMNKLPPLPSAMGLYYESNRCQIKAEAYTGSIVFLTCFLSFSPKQNRKQKTKKKLKQTSKRKGSGTRPLRGLGDVNTSVFDSGRQ